MPTASLYPIDPKIHTDSTEPRQLQHEFNATAIALSDEEAETLMASHVVIAGTEDIVPGNERKREMY